MVKENTMVEQMTRAVWSACDNLLERMPRENRGCMCREVYTWVGDCNGTTREFTELVDSGASVSVSGPVGVLVVTKGGWEGCGIGII